MPSPNIVASFVTFIAIGLLTFVSHNPMWSKSEGVTNTILIVLVANATYYFYYELYSEHDKLIQLAISKPEAPKLLEWAFRFLGQCLLYSLWFLLEYGPILFHIGLIALYIIYISWTVLIWEEHPKHWLAALDLIGLVLAGVFMYAAISKTEMQNFLYGIIVIGYIGISLAGVLIARYNPFRPL